MTKHKAKIPDVWRMSPSLC